MAELGFTGVGVHFGAIAGLDPAQLDRRRCRRAREILAAHGVAIVQSWAFGANLAAPARLVVHVSETVIGDGCFPIASYLQRFEQALPDGYLIVEHLPEELVAQAKAALDGLCAERGITLR